MLIFNFEFQHSFLYPLTMMYIKYTYSYMLYFFFLRESGRICIYYSFELYVARQRSAPLDKKYGLRSHRTIYGTDIYISLT